MKNTNNVRTSQHFKNDEFPTKIQQSRDTATVLL